MVPKKLDDKNQYMYTQNEFVKHSFGIESLKIKYNENGHNTTLRFLNRESELQVSERQKLTTETRFVLIAEINTLFKRVQRKIVS